jgi:HTH-type transcriptional regulator / antitoxin MqsA
MAIPNSAPPRTMVSPDTNETLIRSVRPFAVSYKGETITVDLTGYYPPGDGEGVHVGDDMDPVDAALRLLKSRIDDLAS